MREKQAVTRDAEVFGGGVAVITGAGSGIGAGLARRAGALGMTVIAADIDEAGAGQTVAEIVARGGRGEAVRVDVARAEELDALAEHVFARHGAVRLLVNNAGIETVGYSWEIPADRWDRTLAINVHGVIHGVRAFVPRMLETGQECWIGNVTSVAAFGHMPAQTAYMVSKHAVQSFSECLYLELELKQAPIHVSSIVPGTVRTAIFDARNNAGEPASAQGHRGAMAAMLDEHGMAADDAAALFLAQMAEGRFWVHSHPEMAEAMAAARGAFLAGQLAPVMPEIARHIAVE
ncbi:MAG: SDR family NAD(P)-dependent oxidoreductase [Proteobacteria bacterium]|nr:SDR family NAD(P)-dependent oxidoreductase [Pseudomonadota bacterium]